ncbi:hypothetical protein ACFW34_17765 [Streptomyces sp. NPDC058848]|uniref:hypothetical protein n=1 Tax=unclassified Streptomyces TaxID=2593676 RepID=UPI0036A3C424
MRRRSRFLALLTVASATLATAPAAHAALPVPSDVTTYTYVDLGVLGTNRYGVSISVGVDVNDSRQAVGHSTTAGPSRHGFTWKAGTMSDLAPILDDPYAGSSANGLNDAGHVVGHTSVTSTDPSHAFLRRDGSTIDLGTGYGPGSMSSAEDINSAGQVVGVRSAAPEAPRRAVLWENGTIRDLGTLGGRTGSPYDTESVAYAVNDGGQVVGAALPESGHPLHGFVWENGVMRDLGTLGGNAEATEARDINTAGQIAGNSQTVDGRMHAFLWKEGVMRDLGALGGKENSSYAFGINDRGQVVGQSGQTLTGPARAFLWNGDRMIDLNERVANLPTGVLLSDARAISNDGTVVGTTCSHNCPSDKTAPVRAFMLVPND